MNKTTFEQELERKGRLTYICVGVSMLPLLRQRRDIITIEKKQGRCKKYDVALYKRPNGSYVLHRVVEVREKDYVILGDNCVNKEYGITDENGNANGGFMAIHLMNALSTGGFSIQSGDKAKGQFAFEYTAHYSNTSPETVPFEIYIKTGTV